MKHLLLAMAWFLLPALTSAASFETPVRITDADTTSPAGLSRSSAGSLLWTRDDKLTLVYYDGGQEASFGDQPSHVWLRQWSAAGGWAARELLSQSYYNAEEMGGRHPAVVEREDGTLFAFWHDYRNRSDAGPYDIEIYGDSRPAGGSFSSTDQRLTSSGAIHGGDNGYVPKAAVLPDGRIALVWYDFHWNPGVSEICLRLSDASGRFGAPPAMDSLRLTDAADRYDGNAATLFTMPAVAATSGTLHLCWATGTGSNPQLYYGRVNAGTGELVESTRIATNAAGYYDPAKILAAPDGAVWLVYTLHDEALGDEILACRRPAGAASFEAAVKLVTGYGSQLQPMAVFDKAGLMHLVYVDTLGASRVVYRVYDPAAAAVTEEKTLTAGGGGWQRPAIALDGRGGIYVVWEEEVSSTLGRLWFAWSQPPKNAVVDWTAYD
ncbi:MAG: hypothetical protein ABFD69_02870 [Candidatus Sumerlaeia bacterium]